MTLCRHFGACGGCAVQDMPPDAYLAYKHGLVTDALARAGFDGADVAPVAMVPPRSRRRAMFKLHKRAGHTLAGFNEAASHALVDLAECHVLAPALLDFATSLRAAMDPVLSDGEMAHVYVTQADNGLDVSLHWNRKPTAALIVHLAESARAWPLARLMSGNQPLLSFDAPRVRFGKADVNLPPEAFLQATREGEAMLQSHVRAAMTGARTVADLFSGCGTFTFPLAEKARVHAVEMDGPMLAALGDSARRATGLKPVTFEARNLFKRPLDALDLSRYDGVVLNPPRAGAEAQVKMLAVSKLKRLAYVSCNAGTFARDAAILTAGGWRMGMVQPVDQFLWTGHIELTVAFTR